VRTPEAARQYYNGWSDFSAEIAGRGWKVPRMLVRALMPRLVGGERILDVGCGTGLIGRELARAGWRGELVGIDVAEARLREASRTAAYTVCKRMNAYRLTFRAACFDAVISSAVVGMVGPRAVREMRRVIRPGGYLVCASVEYPRMQWSRVRCRSAKECIQALPRTCVLKCSAIRRPYAVPESEERYTLYVARCV
jgi:ubiquinone/menaquinone biosynthesis C-methylase UbiE